MTAPFQRSYASLYDAWYADKDYEGECDQLEAIFARFLKAKPRTILDLGCGTGGHAIPLAKRGYAVTGVDRSAEMVARGRAKAESLAARGLPAPDLHVGDLQSFDLGRSFDVAVSMFAVMGYLASPDSLHAALSNAREHLEPGGLLVFDVWSGPALLASPPVDRYRSTTVGPERVIRFARPQLSLVDQTVDVRYTILRMHGDRVVEETEESHVMRFFFPREIDLALRAAGFKLLHLSPVGALDAPLTASDWNVEVVAVAT